MLRAKVEIKNDKSKKLFFDIDILHYWHKQKKLNKIPPLIVEYDSENPTASN